MDMANQTTENIDRTVNVLKDGVSTSASAGIHQAQNALHTGMQKMIKATEEMVSFSHGNVEAMAKSNQILLTGMQDISQSLAAAAKTSMEETVNGFKALSSVKSFKDFFELQTALVRSAVERGVAQTSQLTEHSFKLSERAYAPIGARLSLATDRLGRLG